MITVTHDHSQSVKDLLEGRITAQALKFSKSSASRAMIASVKRIVRSERTIKHTKIDAVVKRVSSVSSESIVVSGQPIPVVGLPHRQLRKGVKFSVSRKETSFIRGAFLATMKSGHKGVWKRTGKSTKWGREEINEVYTTGIASVFQDQNNVDTVLEAGQKAFSATMRRMMKPRV